MTTNNDDTQNEVSGITLKDSKNNGLSDRNTVEVITPNNIQTNSDDTNLTEQLKKGELKVSYGVNKKKYLGFTPQEGTILNM